MVEGDETVEDDLYAAEKLSAVVRLWSYNDFSEAIDYVERITRKCDNGMPFTMTLGCGTWGGNISSDNITWKNFLNTTWVSKPIAPVIPNEAEIFGEFFHPNAT